MKPAVFVIQSDALRNWFADVVSGGIRFVADSLRFRKIMWSFLFKLCGCCNPTAKSKRCGDIRFADVSAGGIRFVADSLRFQKIMWSFLFKLCGCGNPTDEIKTMRRYTFCGSIRRYSICSGFTSISKNNVCFLFKLCGCSNPTAEIETMRRYTICGCIRRYLIRSGFTSIWDKGKYGRTRYCSIELRRMR